ncbi:MAG: tetratricopeptide repeat protein [Quinella sp. 1Q5]|nr:tetratricopeptide repeat protein [Quinella sp. 1Q5]
MGKIIRRTLTALLIVIFALSAAIVGAKIQMYTATGEDYANEVESQDIAKLRARDKAIKKATKEAGVYLKTYSRTVNSELTDDEVTAIMSNAWQLVGEPKYSSKIVKGSDETSIIIWTATVEVNVDDSEIQSWIKRDSEDKTKIINQTREAQKASEENERKIEDLREKYNRATSQAEKDSLRKQMTDADRDFLANQKFEEANKLYYAKNYQEAIKLYDELLNFGGNASVYNNRGNAYLDLKQYERAIQDYDKAIQLNPNHEMAYNNRGLAYGKLGQKDKEIQDYESAIKLNPNYAGSYYNRGGYYLELKQYERAIQDYSKAIELNPILYQAYYNRGNVYLKGLEQYEQAIKDYSTAIYINPDLYEAYVNRGISYALSGKPGNLEKAIEDATKAIQLNPKRVDAYMLRGNIYQALGETEKSQADFAKGNEIIKNKANESLSMGEKLKKDVEERLELEKQRDKEREERNKEREKQILKHTEAIALNPNDYYAYFYRGCEYIFMDQYERAIQDFDKAIEINPNFSYAYYNRGICYQQLGDEAKAQADFAKAKELGYNG